MAYCEDFPCCGHTAQDPCGRQWFDEPGAFDTSRPGNEHALCDHENGFCEIADNSDDDDELDVEDARDAELAWEAAQDEAQRAHDEWLNDTLAQDGRWG
jgi:hypothetical protein